MLVIGIDPGTRFLGWGIVRRAGSRLTHIAHGVIATTQSQALAHRLLEIDNELGEVIAKYCPEAAAVETLFFHKDPQAASKLGHARGVVLLALSRANIDIAEYSPALVKRTIVGRGAADKRQVAQIVKAALSLDDLPQFDATDALALAMTHLRVAHLPQLRLTPSKRGAQLPAELMARLRKP